MGNKLPVIFGQPPAVLGDTDRDSEWQLAQARCVKLYSQVCKWIQFDSWANMLQQRHTH